jgi:hypothetical protein
MSAAPIWKLAGAIVFSGCTSFALYDPRKLAGLFNFVGLDVQRNDPTGLPAVGLCSAYPGLVFLLIMACVAINCASPHR